MGRLNFFQRGNDCSHKWNYIDPEHRICSKCGKCQHYVFPPPYLPKVDGYVGENYVQGRQFWETTTSEILQQEVEREKQAIKAQEELQASIKQTALFQQRKASEDREKAFLLLSSFQSSDSVWKCKYCGSKNLLKNKECITCGKPLAR
jgi:uncharacterized OB-fold protein